MKLCANDKKETQFASSVCVCGSGHQGLSMAAHLALNNVKVTMWNRSVEHIHEIIDSKEIICNGIVKGIAKIEKASTRMDDVISDFVMVTTPSSAHKDIAKQLAPFVHKNMVIVLNPGRTFGAIEFARTLIVCGVKELPHIAETQTIVYTCRRGAKNSTTIFALKANVKIAALKSSDINYIMDKMPECLKSYFAISDSVLETSLTNVGMVLHCAPVMMNVGWIETSKVDFKYYYDGISQSIAGFLEKIDVERQAVSSAVGCSVESVADWLRRTYHCNGSNLYECIQNNKSYKEIDAPPTIHCRYIFEDVPNGLVPIEALGKELGVETPNITTIIDLASSVMNTDFRLNGRTFSLELIRKYI